MRKGGSSGYLIREGFSNTWANRLMSFASIGVLVCCLVLMGAAGLVSLNISSLMQWVENQNVIKVFIDDNADDARVSEIGVELENLGNVRNCEFVPKEEALEDLLGNYSEDLQTIADLQEDGQNPLPDAYRVTVIDLANYDITLKHIKEIDGVLSVADKRDYAEKLININRMVTIVGFAIVGLLLLVSLFIITNTIKLTMYVRKLEISIMKSVGATNWFIRIPFMIEGLVIGFISGIIAFLIIWGVYDIAVNSLVQAINSMALLQFNQVALWLLGVFVLSGMFIGSFGSLISIRKYLKKEGGLYND